MYKYPPFDVECFLFCKYLFYTYLRFGHNFSSKYKEWTNIIKAALPPGSKNTQVFHIVTLTLLSPCAHIFAHQILATFYKLGL